MKTTYSFLISRYYQQLRLQQIDMFADKIVPDYMFAKDKLFAQTSLDDNEMILYKKLANIFEKNICEKQKFYRKFSKLCQSFQEHGPVYTIHLSRFLGAHTEKYVQSSDIHSKFGCCWNNRQGSFGGSLASVLDGSA